LGRFLLSDPPDMALTVLADSVERRAAEIARREALITRLTADDATRDQREKKKKSKKRGVWAALAEAGIRLTQDQHHAVDSVLTRHPELGEHVFSASEAVERLAAYGVPFTDGQLELVSDETTISGLRSAACAFEDRRRAPSSPKRRATTSTAKGKRVMRQPAWRAWLGRALAWLRPT
jgi:hypothetical protein